MKTMKFLTIASAVAPALAMANEEMAAAAGVTNVGMAYIAAGVCMGFATAFGTLAQSKTAGAALSGMARNPAAAKGLFTPLVLSLALIEFLVILAFVIAIMLTGK